MKLKKYLVRIGKIASDCMYMEPRYRVSGIANECCKKAEFYLVCKHCRRVFEFTEDSKK